MSLNSDQAIENGRILLREHGTWLKVIASQRSTSGTTSGTTKPAKAALKSKSS